MTILKVGGAEIEVDEAKALVAEYVSKSGGWAYPAYDAYEGSGGTTVGDADLLAPLLLNVRNLSLDAYYAMQALLPEINSQLSELAGMTLLEADDETLSKLADLLALHETRQIPGVLLTTFSKVLHRMAPELIPLYDDHIRRCYMELGQPVIPTAKKGTRNWTEFTILWLRAVQADLRVHHDEWRELAGLAEHPTITPLRALDMIGWRLGRPGGMDGQAVSDTEV
ncbi:hypothetical protein JNB_00305 [Janibacter sp. HTCC2649]|uniref:DUF6308 family protein n=1 Tax=Janibacter sp. HTCC2649 TaxID=313589 RepID=UPI000066EBAF|nr:DUF6308 family protein [Janibacter sp. HTCC2649]EAP98563.1 hypothetical protein JNB_00305 [Janibacter sp. HTCC2649]